METTTIVRLAFLSVSALLLGYLAYRGTRWELGSLQLEGQLQVFQDKYWSAYSACPATGAVCVKAKCAPAVMQLYFRCKTRLVDAFNALPQNAGSLFSFGAYWVASSAAAIILAVRWFASRSVEISTAYAALPIVLCVVLSRACALHQGLPKPFSKEIPTPGDPDAFENAIQSYCLHLDGCTEIVRKAAAEARACRTYAAVLSAFMWGIVIAVIIPA